MHWLASSVTIPISWTDSNAPFAKWPDKSMPDPEDIGGYMYAWLIISFDNPVDNLIAAGFGARVTPIDAWSVAV